MQKTMTIMYNNLLKRILFPSLSIYFFPHFFPSPNPNFGASWGKMGIFFYFENRKFVSLSFHILFSPFLPIPKSKFRCVLGKNGVRPPLILDGYTCGISVLQQSFYRTMAQQTILHCSCSNHLICTATLNFTYLALNYT